MSLADCSDVLESLLDIDSPKKSIPKSKHASYVELRGRYPRYAKKKKQVIFDSNWKDIGSVLTPEAIHRKGEKLARLIEKGKYCHIIKIFRNSKDLDSAVKKCRYLRWDYKVSPRAARKILFYALGKFLDSSELEGIDPDPFPYGPFEEY